MWLRRLLHTPNDGILTFLRIVLGIVFFAHGAQIALGWFGGSGFDETVRYFERNLGIPPFLATLTILSEFLGGIGLIAGLLSRIAALGILVDMAVAVAMVHLPNGFFMNWYGNQHGEGFEYHLLVMAIAITVIVRGAGALSLDRVLDSKLEGGRTLEIRMEPQPTR